MKNTNNEEWKMLRWSDVALCYLILLDRLPEEREIADGRQKSAAGLLSQLISRTEFSNMIFLSYFGADPNNRHTAATGSFYGYIEELGRERLEALAQRIEVIPRKVESGHDYVAFHAKRMRELMGFLERWDRDSPIGSLLDIGLSPFFALYSELFPGIDTFLVDCWPHPKEKLLKLGAGGFQQVDLNKEWISSELGGKVTRRFDVIVCTEVIEHLLIDPAEAIRDLLSLLKPGGIIYFSTPNYLSSANLLKLLDHCNPQPRYSKAVGNADAHYHLREYSMLELEDAVRQAGGKLVFHAFSDCWDQDLYSPEQLRELPVSLRSNLLLMIGLAEDHPDKHEVNPMPAGIPAEDAQEIFESFRSDFDQVMNIDAAQAGGTLLDRLSFDEVWYLRNNRDVAEAVKTGTFASGWEHYDQYGRQEGRRARRRLIRVGEE